MNADTDRCDLCGGELQPGATTLNVWHDGRLLVIKDVRADVCQQCGEAYLSAAMSVQLDDFLAHLERQTPARYLTVPEYSVANAVGS